MNKSQNTFNKGLSMDYHPLSSPNTSLSNCLNGTFISFNGNEYILQNDMGNGRVETAYLPSGYIPVGVTSFGGIIYIASYNPLNKKCLLGCFPSPERNFTEDESESNVFALLDNSMFINNNNDVINSVVKIKLSDISLQPGDKYLITSSGLNENITDYKNTLDLLTIGSNPKYLRLRIATSNESGQFIYLDSDIKWYKLKNQNDKYYYIYDEIKSNVKNDIVNIREITNSNYSIFNSKISGELYIVGQLEQITSFDFSYFAKNENNKYQLYFDFYWSSEHESIKPQGAIVIINNTETTECLFKDGTECLIKEFDKKEGIYNIEIIPCMDYGKLNQYKIKYTIDLSKINTGDISLSLWRYYNSSDSVLLYYGLNSYPEDGWYFHELKLTFINKLLYNTEYNTEYIVIDSGRNSYSGVFSKEILYDNLDLNQIYGVTIEALYKKQNDNNTEWKEDENTKIKTVAKRILYTTSVFNNDFLNSTTDDFKNLYINFTPELSIKELTFNSLQYKGKWIKQPVITDLTENVKNTSLAEYLYELTGEVNLDPEIITDCGFDVNKRAIQNLLEDDIEVNIQFDDYNDLYIGNTTEKINDKFISDYIKPEIKDKSISVKNFKIGINCNVSLKGLVTSIQNKEIAYKGILKPYIYNLSDCNKFIMSTTNNGHLLYLNYLGYCSEATMFNIQFDSLYSNAMTFNAIGDRGTYAKSDQEGDLPSTSGSFASATIEKIRDNFSNTNVMPFIFAGAPDRYSMDFIRQGNAAGGFTYWNSNSGFMTQTENLYYFHDGINKWDFKGNRTALWDTVYLHNPAYYTPGKYPNWITGISYYDTYETCVPMYINNPDRSNGTVGTSGLLIKSDNGVYIIINGYGHLFADSTIGQRLCYNSKETPITCADAVASFFMQTYYVLENSLDYCNVPKDFSYYDQIRTNINVLIISKYDISTSDILFNKNNLDSLKYNYKDYDYGNNFDINGSLKGETYNTFTLTRTINSEPIVELYSNPNKLNLIKIKTNTYGGLYDYELLTDEYIGRDHTYAFYNRNGIKKLYRISYNDNIPSKIAQPFNYVNDNHQLVDYYKVTTEYGNPLYNDLLWGLLGIYDNKIYIPRNENSDLMPSCDIKSIRNDTENDMPLLVNSLTDTGSSLYCDINGKLDGSSGDDHQFWLHNINYSLSICKYLRGYIHCW